MEGPLAIAQAFTEQTFHYTSQAELASGLEACTFELGFHRFAILHHVDLRRRPAAMIHIDNYPAVCDRKSGVEGRSVSVGVDRGGRRNIKTKKNRERR